MKEATPPCILSEISYLDVSLTGVSVRLVGDGQSDPAVADVLEEVADDKLLLEGHVASYLLCGRALVAGDWPGIETNYSHCTPTGKSHVNQMRKSFD